jgi:prepilin-type N-terminal cleavage/methylation domain-containing protein
MKEKSVGNGLPAQAGFSTLEIMIAMAIISIALVGALGANYSAQYWSITSQTSNEGLYKAKTKLEDLRALVKQDFYQANSSALTRSVDPTDPNDTACLAGGLCYYIQTIITDISSCSKFVEADVSWQVPNYATTTTTLFTNLTNSGEATALGGDCILNQPSGNWGTNAPQTVENPSSPLTFSPGKIFTSIDVLHKEIFATASTSPYFLVYNTPIAVGQNPVLAGSTDGSGMRLNDVDVEEDLATGRTYAFAAENATTTGLAVFDVTDPTTPTLVTERQLQGVDLYGSYPQAWRVYVYGGRLYLTTRETAGNELHIFNINVPTQPTEVGTGFALDRTVNDLVVRDQKVSGVVHRFAYLASQADAKQLSVLDVTNDVITEVAAVAGAPDGDSLALLGHTLYMGTEPSSGPELYAFDVTNPASALPVLGSAELGASVTTLRVSGSYLYVGTNKSGQEFQVWNATPASMSRLQSYSFSHLAPNASFGLPFGKGFDVDGNWVYLISQWKNAPGDALQVLRAL